MRVRGELFAALFAAGASACIPYTVGTTAQPVAAGKTTAAMMTYVMPSISFDTANRTPYTGHSNLAVDAEVRMGVDDKSDVGLRAVGYSGLIVNYKRLMTDTASALRWAIIPGIGIVNGGDHVYGEFTFVVSGHEPPTDARRERGRAMFVPYGGVRMSKVSPLAENAVTDEPTFGGFFGMRIGSTDFGISPEVGVFHDHSALGVRRSDIVVVPAIVVHGTRLISIFSRIPRRFDEQRPHATPRDPYPGAPILPPILRPSPTPAPLPCSAQRRACSATRRPDVTAHPRS